MHKQTFSPCQKAAAPRVSIKATLRILCFFQLREGEETPVSPMTPPGVARADVPPTCPCLNTRLLLTFGRSKGEKKIGRLTNKLTQCHVEGTSTGTCILKKL